MKRGDDASFIFFNLIFSSGYLAVLIVKFEYGSHCSIKLYITFSQIGLIFELVSCLNFK